MTQEMRKLGLTLSILLLVSVFHLIQDHAFAVGDCGPENPLACRPAPKDLDPMMLEAKAMVMAAAPGYCSSAGGSTEYESISSVSIVQNQDNLTITVNVYIANPTGCTAGSSCPEYDNSPEYVNVWIDYDGDGSWENHEKVMNEAGTGYLNINYQGTMTFIKTVSIPPGAVADTWLRANLGWGYDPDNPCESSWTWGNVLDREVHIETTVPEIEDIEISPTNPETTKDVTFTAKLKNMDDYEVVKVAWAGDVDSGEGNPSYTVKPAAGTHGKDKNIIATLTYRKIGTDQTGTHSKSKKFNLFFVKAGDEDGDGKPNWFEHWKTDGAVPNMGPAKYDSTSTAYGYMTGGGDLYLTPYSAGQHYGSAIVLTGTHFGTESFGGPNVKGIDCAAEVVAHENYHKWVNDQWKTGGSFNGKTDSDKGVPSADCDDKLPDFYETATSHTKNDDCDTYDLEHKKSSTYRRYGDNEYMAMRAGDGARGTPTKDWANPGKQTTPAYDLAPTVGAAQAASGAVQASFTGNNSDQGVDTDQDGKYELLRVSVEVDVISAGAFRALAFLKDNSDNVIKFVNIPLSLSAGIQNVTLDFDGTAIWEHGVDGSFNVSISLSDEYGNPIDTEDHTTQAYAFTDFNRTSSNIIGNYAESLPDANSNGLAEALDIAVDVNVINSGELTIEGYLHASDGTPITYATVSQSLASGPQTLHLTFDGRKIRQSHTDGPYKLRSVALYEGTSLTDFVYEAYETSALSSTAFERSGAEFAAVSTFNDYGVDLNADGLFDVLRIEMTADISQAGQYSLVGCLFDNDANSIDDTTTQLTLAEGQQTFSLDFSGTAIRRHGLPGPYILQYVFLYGSDGSLLDSLPDVYTTQDYQIWQFQMLLAGLTGNFFDEGRDTNGNGLFDQLVIGVEVDATDSGNVVVQARLESGDGTDLGNETNFVPISNGPEWVELTFDGSTIFASGDDGPYVLTDVRAYHTGDPEQSELVEDAYLTAYYSADKFEPISVIRGTVKYLNGAPIGGAVVSAGGKTVYSDSNGQYYLGLQQSGSITVAIDPPPDVPDGPWKFFVDGILAGGDQSVTVEVEIGVVVQVDCVLITDVIHPADTNSDNVISMLEILAYIDKWAVGDVSMLEVLEGIDLWAAGHYYWDESEQNFKPGEKP